MPVTDGWNDLCWLDLEEDLFRLQKRIYRASIRGDYGKPRRSVDDNHQTTEEPDEVETLTSGSEAERRE